MPKERRKSRKRSRKQRNVHKLAVVNAFMLPEISIGGNRESTTVFS